MDSKSMKMMLVNLKAIHTSSIHYSDPIVIQCNRISDILTG